MSPLNLKICFFFFITKIIISCCSCTITLSPCSLLVSLLMANDESHNQLPETDTLLHGYHPNSPNRWSRGSQTITATTNLSYLSAKRLATCSITLQGQRAPDGTWILQCKGVFFFFFFFQKHFLTQGIGMRALPPELKPDPKVYNQCNTMQKQQDNMSLFILVCEKVSSGLSCPVCSVFI